MHRQRQRAGKRPEADRGDEQQRPDQIGHRAGQRDDAAREIVKRPRRRDVARRQHRERQRHQHARDACRRSRCRWSPASATDIAELREIRRHGAPQDIGHAVSAGDQILRPRLHRRSQRLRRRSPTSTTATPTRARSQAAPAPAHRAPVAGATCASTLMRQLAQIEPRTVGRATASAAADRRRCGRRAGRRCGRRSARRAPAGAARTAPPDRPRCASRRSRRMISSAASGIEAGHRLVGEQDAAGAAPARARSPTRCAWPPDSVPARCPREMASADLAENSCAGGKFLGRQAAERRPPASMAAERPLATLASTLRRLTRLACWKIIAQRQPRLGAARSPRQPGEVRAVDPHLARGRIEQPRDAAQQRRLAAAVAAEDDHEFAGAARPGRRRRAPACRSGSACDRSRTASRPVPHRRSGVTAC